jgi:hypothetical protein
VHVLENRNVEPTCSMSTINNPSDSSNDSTGVSNDMKNAHV